LYEASVLEFQKTLCRSEVEELNVEGSNYDTPCGLGKGNERYKKENEDAFKYLIAIPPRFVLKYDLFYTI